MAAVRSRRLLAGQGRDDTGHSGGIEHHLIGDLDSEGVAQARDDARCQERVTAQVKKVVMDAYLVQLKHLFPDAGDQLLGRVARPDIG